MFMYDFSLFLENKIKDIFELDYMCSVFTFVQYIFECYRNTYQKLRLIGFTSFGFAKKNHVA